MLKSVAAVLLAFFLLSCGSDSGGTGPDPKPDPSVATSVTVSPSTSTLTALGSTAQLSAVVKDQKGQTMSGASVSWASSNGSVLTVSTSGLATAVAVGTATVTATSSTANGSAAVTVQQTPAEIQVSVSSDQVAPGGTVQATVTVSDAGGSAIPGATIVWATTDPAVASIGNDGLVTGVGAGLVFVKATAGSLADSTQVSVSTAHEQGQLSIVTDATGGAAVYSALGGGTHFQLEVKNETGQGVEGASVEYAEEGDQAFIAIRKTSHAPAFLFGTVEELKTFGEAYTPTPGELAAATVVGDPGVKRAPSEAILLKVSLPSITSAQLPVIQNALRLQSFLHQLGTVEIGTGGAYRGRRCMTWAEFAQEQIDHLTTIPGWEDVVTILSRGDDPSYFDADPVPGEAAIYFSAQDVVSLLTGGDLLAEKVGLLGSLLEESPTGRRIDVEWHFADAPPPIRQALGTFRVNTNDPYCGGGIPAAITPVPPTLNGTPSQDVTATVRVDSHWTTVVPGVSVSFTLDPAHGTFQGDGPTKEIVTDENGMANVAWTLPGDEGTYTLTATAPGPGGQILSTTITAYAQTFDVIPTFGTFGTGTQHTCGMDIHNQIFCWGLNGNGELGTGERTHFTTPDAWKSTPTPIVNNHPVTFEKVFAGGNHNCALTTTGMVYCWGRNSYRQVGHEDPWATTDVWTPYPVQGGHVFTTLALGGSHSCGLRADHYAYCWGRNTEGQLGNGTNEDSSIPTRVGGGMLFESLHAGGLHTCGIGQGTGIAYCWGANTEGQLGQSEAWVTDPAPGHFEPALANRNSPVSLTEYNTMTTMAGGWYHTCGVGTNGKTYCWGKNGNGQLGGGSYSTQVPQTVPGEVIGGLTFDHLTAGAYHTCGLTAEDVAYCWGRAGDGQLGYGPDGTDDQHQPTMVYGGHTFPVLHSGSHHTCGIAMGGVARCWGDNAKWQLGQNEPGGIPDDSPIPLLIQPTNTFRFGRPPGGQ